MEIFHPNQWIPSSISVPASIAGRIARLAALAGLCLIPLNAAGNLIVDFGDLSLPEHSFWNGSDQSGGFTSGGASFNNHYDDEWGTWGGWSYSNVDDTETRGFENQYAAITGTGADDNAIYGVAFVDDFQPTIPTATLPVNHYPESVTVTNTTYAYYSMLEGDDFANPFSTEGDGDWFLLTITGLDAGGAVTGTREFYLADYRFEEPNDAYIIDEWTTVDVSALGPDTRALEFTLSSSDEGAFGMNTPAYFAMGEITAVPEPATTGLLTGAGIMCLVAFRRLRPKRKAPHRGKVPFPEADSESWPQS